MERRKRRRPGTEPWDSPIWRTLGEEEEVAKEMREVPLGDWTGDQVNVLPWKPTEENT